MTLNAKRRDEIWYALDAARVGRIKFLFAETKDEYKEMVAYLKDRKKRYYPKGWTQLEDKLFYTYELSRFKNGGMVKITWDPDRARSNAHKKSHRDQAKKLKKRSVLLPWG